MAAFMIQFLSLLAVIPFACSSPLVPLAPRAHVVYDASELRDEYDYVVVGGGTSGLTVANRLTENPKTTVLVIEYGYVDSQEPGVLVPGVQVPAKYSRNYQSVPQPGLNGRSSPVFSGAVVGGGSVVNGMFFTRGSAGDYDAWEKLGNPGWGWKDLLPYFKKSETFTPPPKELAAQYPISSDLSPHGTDGPVGSSFSNYQYPVIKYFFRGWNSIGIASQPQPNAGNPNGAFYSTLSLTAKNQTRSSAASAYYRPIAGKRGNFHLITGQTVTKINFVGKRHPKAISVNYVSRNTTSDEIKSRKFTTNTAKARHEVILAAGAVHSSQILQLSGVGPKPLLSKLGIPILVNLPGVGNNFQDQPTMFMSFTYSNFPFPTPDWLVTNKTWYDEELAVYYKNRTGPFTITWFSGSIVAFLPLQNITQNYKSIIKTAAAVDLASLLPKNTDHTILAGYKAQRDLILQLYASPHATAQEVAFGGGNTVPVVVLKPLSRGSITINTTDPTAPPVFDYGTFSHPTDLEIAVQAIKKTRQWMRSAPMQEIGAVESYPGTNITSDEDIAASIRTFARSTWAHPSGTLSMMKREYGGVVDSQLQVYGVKGLRVVDASIMPLIPGTHTSSTVYAVAEKAADLIKAAYKHK